MTFALKQHSFVWTLVLAFLVFFIVKNNQGRLLFYWVILVFVLYGGDWYELWGRRLSMWIEQAGLVGLGNILMLVTAVYAFRRPIRAGEARD